MHKRTGFVLCVLMTACAIQASLLSGCSEGKSSSASRALMDGIVTAQRRFAKASALWANPVFKYKPSGAKEKLSPMPSGTVIQPSETNRIEVLPGSAMNPKVLDILKETQGNLEKAIRDNADADEATRALAEATLGRIIMLRGQYYAAKAASRQAAARIIADRVDISIRSLNARLVLIANYERLSKVNNAKLEKIIKEAASQLTATNKQIVAIDAKIIAKTKSRDALTVATSKLHAQAGKLRTSSRLASGKEGLNLLEKALAKEKIAGKNEADIARYDYDIQAMKTREEDLRLKAQSFVARKESAEKIAKARTQAGDAQAKQKELLAKELDKPYVQIEQSAETLVSSLDGAAKMETKAIGVFKSAAMRMHKAASLEAKIAGGNRARSRPESSASAGEADLLAARVQTDVLTVRSKVQDTARHLRNLWKAMGRRGKKLTQLADKIAAYAPDPAKLQAEAEKSFDEAIKMYDRAVRFANSKIAWTYQGQLAVAYADLYDLYQTRLGELKRTGGDRKTIDDLTQRASSALDNARKTCATALKDKENSPHLAQIRQLARMLESAR